MFRQIGSSGQNQDGDQKLLEAYRTNYKRLTEQWYGKQIDIYEVLQGIESTEADYRDYARLKIIAEMLCFLTTGKTLDEEVLSSNAT